MLKPNTRRALINGVIVDSDYDYIVVDRYANVKSQHRNARNAIKQAVILGTQDHDLYSWDKVFGWIRVVVSSFVHIDPVTNSIHIINCR